MPLRHLENIPAQLLERPLAAREDDDLLVACLAVQGVEHTFDALIVGIDQRIIEDHRRGAPIAREQARESQAREDR